MRAITPNWFGRQHFTLVSIVPCKVLTNPFKVYAKTLPPMRAMPNPMILRVFLRALKKRKNWTVKNSDTCSNPGRPPGSVSSGGSYTARQPADLRQRRQNAGVNSTSRVNTSSRPSSIEKHSSPLAASLMPA